MISDLSLTLTVTLTLAAPAQDECFVLTVPDPTGQEPQGIFPHLESPLVRDLMLLLEYDASPECARCPDALRLCQRR